MTGGKALVTFGALACLGAATGGYDGFSRYTSLLHDAKSLTAVVTVQSVGGSLQTINVALQKPNLVRLETDTDLTVCDGTLIYHYGKAAKTFTKSNVSDPLIKSALSGLGLLLVAGIIDDGVFSGFTQVRSLGRRKARGSTYDVFTSVKDDGPDTTYTFYIDPTDSLAKLADVTSVSSAGTSTTILSLKSVAVDGSVSPDVFKFSPPTGAQDMSADAPLKFPREQMPNLDGYRTLPAVGQNSCCPTATANAIAWLTMNGFSGIADESLTPNERADRIANDLVTYFKTDSARGTLWTDMFNGLHQYFLDKGYANTRVGLYSWINNSTWTQVNRLGRSMPTLGVLKEDQTHNSFMMLSIGWVNNPDASNKCQQTMWHWATVVAVDPDAGTVTLHDPYQVGNPEHKPLVLRMTRLPNDSKMVLTGNTSYGLPEYPLANMYVLQEYPNCASNQFAVVIGAVVVTVAK